MKFNGNLDKSSLITKSEFVNIVTQISKGMKSGLAAFYEVYGKGIYLIAKTICKDQKDADIVVNDVLKEVWNSAEQLAQNNNPNEWIYNITVNAANDYIQRKRWFPLTESMDYDINALPRADGSGSYGALVSALSADEQQIIILLFVNKLPFESVAKILDMPISRVNELYYNAFYKMKESLNNNA